MISEDSFDIEALFRNDVSVVTRGRFFIGSNWNPTAVTEQFLNDAQSYHQRYFDRSGVKEVIDRLLALAKIDTLQPQVLLDVGSGSGPSVLTLASIMPKAKIVAADISPQLLSILMEMVAEHGAEERIKACCFDLHVPYFKENSFDLAIGMAILHHLLHPDQVLRNIAAALKPGGKMIFVEPLEAGNLLLTMIYERILQQLDFLKMEEPLGKLMTAMRLDTQARLGVPAIKPWTTRLDDKWVFPESYLLSLPEKIGLTSVEVHPASLELGNLYLSCFYDLLRASGNASLEIPQAVIEIIAEFDAGISPQLKEKLCPTGIIVFRK